MQIFLGIVHSLRHCSMQRHRSVHCKFDFTHIHLPEQPALQLHLISSIQALAAYGRMVQQVDIAGFSELLLLLHSSILFKPYCSGGGTTGSATKILSPDMTCLIGCSSHMLVKTSVWWRNNVHFPVLSEHVLPSTIYKVQGGCPLILKNHILGLLTTLQTKQTYQAWFSTHSMIFSSQ